MKFLSTRLVESDSHLLFETKSLFLSLLLSLFTSLRINFSVFELKLSVLFFTRGYSRLFPQSFRIVWAFQLNKSHIMLDDDNNDDWYFYLLLIILSLPFVAFIVHTDEVKEIGKRLVEILSGRVLFSSKDIEKLSCDHFQDSRNSFLLMASSSLFLNPCLYLKTKPTNLFFTHSFNYSLHYFLFPTFWFFSILPANLVNTYLIVSGFVLLTFPSSFVQFS